jgi:predicted  nucleic acid-binding Zn ribbon protein
MGFVIELTYQLAPDSPIDDDKASHLLNFLLGVYRMNGQIVGREWGIARDSAMYRIAVLCPEETSLDDRWDNKYTRSAKDEIRAAGLVAHLPRVIGYDIDGAAPCACAAPTAYILTTNYLSLESPLRCGDCFDQAPLYRLPKTYDDEYSDIIGWQSNYQACDTLFMNSVVLERATHREMSRIESALSQEGHQICRQIEQLTGIPTYYRVQTHYGRSLRSERKRCCPLCGEQWLLEEAWHRFDFKCVTCRLVGNIAYSL